MLTNTEVRQMVVDHARDYLPGGWAITDKEIPFSLSPTTYRNLLAQRARHAPLTPEVVSARLALESRAKEMDWILTGAARRERERTRWDL